MVSELKSHPNIVIRAEVLSIQRLKSLLVHLFWSETKVFLWVVLFSLFISLIEWALVIFEGFVHALWVFFVRG